MEVDSNPPPIILVSAPAVFQVCVFHVNVTNAAGDK
jgi:hypothetical protein